MSVDILNQYLQVIWEPLHFAFFFRHRGLQNPSEEVLLPNGVHLDSKGQYLVYRSYRGAILTAKDMASTRPGGRCFVFWCCSWAFPIVERYFIFKLGSKKMFGCLPELYYWQHCILHLYVTIAGHFIMILIFYFAKINSLFTQIWVLAA